jgi:hypothetical protein
MLRPNSRSCRTASIRSGIAGGLAGELLRNRLFWVDRCGLAAQTLRNLIFDSNTADVRMHFGKLPIDTIPELLSVLRLVQEPWDKIYSRLNGRHISALQRKVHPQVFHRRMSVFHSSGQHPTRVSDAQPDQVAYSVRKEKTMRSLIHQ